MDVGNVVPPPVQVIKYSVPFFHSEVDIGFVTTIANYAPAVIVHSINNARFILYSPFNIYIPLLCLLINPNHLKELLWVLTSYCHQVQAHHLNALQMQNK